MNKQGLSKLLKQVTAGAGALFVVVALVRLPHAQPIAALLGFLLITLVVNARFAIPVPREWWCLSPNESLILLAMLLFGGEAAVLLAALSAFCLALRSGRGWLNLSYVAAVTVISTGLLVLLYGQLYGDVSALYQADSFHTYLGVLAVAIPVQTAARFITSGLAVGFVTVQDRWHAWARILLNSLLISFVGVCAAGLVAKLIGVVGFDSFSYIAPVVAACSVTWDAFRGNKHLR
ncbi:MAG TPA: hypothetical protein VE775_03010, partial [Pyrinomonadaceae bacterium]|nr:hypothetical protein [Pyrinomonadaceae bacterium]